MQKFKDMDRLIKIYILRDPITKEIRYLGRTSKSKIEHRLMEHISKAKFHKKYNRKSTHLTNWINKLLNLGFKPLIEEIETIVGWKESHARERYLIEEYGKIHKLTNINDKGSGPENTVVTDEQKLKISTTLKRKYREENLRNAGYESLRKPVYQFLLDGTFVEKHESIAKASFKLGIAGTQICDICLKHKGFKTAKGFTFSYDSKFPSDILVNNNHVEISILNTENNEILTFNSLAECSRILNIPKTCLNRLINNTNKTYKTYKFYDKRRGSKISG